MGGKNARQDAKGRPGAGFFGGGSFTGRVEIQTRHDLSEQEGGAPASEAPNGVQDALGKAAKEVIAPRTGGNLVTRLRPQAAGSFADDRRVEALSLVDAVLGNLDEVFVTIDFSDKLVAFGKIGRSDKFDRAGGRGGRNRAAGEQTGPRVVVLSDARRLLVDRDTRHVQAFFFEKVTRQVDEVGGRVVKGHGRVGFEEAGEACDCRGTDCFCGDVVPLL